jgi:hypothetical protein
MYVEVSANVVTGTRQQQPSTALQTQTWSTVDCPPRAAPGLGWTHTAHGTGHTIHVALAHEITLISVCHSNTRALAAGSGGRTPGPRAAHTLRSLQRHGPLVRSAVGVPFSMMPICDLGHTVLMLGCCLLCLVLCHVHHRGHTSALTRQRITLCAVHGHMCAQVSQH